MAKEKLSTENYKGVRDFYPEEMFVQNYIYGVWRKTVESFGYVEYSASILEPAELYKAKSGEEIVNEQTYTFKDRGDREVTLRPEMTPTVARMVAGKEKELNFPLRWYSIPNLFRYEKPQRGRLREHFQLNVDLFGVDSTRADLEIVAIAHKIMKNFGAKDSDFVIKINSRKLTNDLYKHFDLDETKSGAISKILDKKDKISESDFENSLKEIVQEKAVDFARLVSSSERFLEILGKDNENAKELVDVIENLSKIGIKNVVFTPTLMRGFDYYTGIVFEMFDTDPNNNRALFGGGRYDDLLDIFDTRKIPAVGFGFGDVTNKDFLETHGLLPKYEPTADVYVATTEKSLENEALKLTESLRDKGINVSLDLTEKKVGDQLKTAHKQVIPYVIVVGPDEVKSGLYPLKNMDSGEEKKVKAEEIPEMLKNRTEK